MGHTKVCTEISQAASRFSLTLELIQENLSNKMFLKDVSK